MNFFFQAEDGIRDSPVTGVQTCALPICAEKLNKESCTHSDEERSLLGAWTTEELKLAVTYGYEIKHIYQVYHYKYSSSDVFKNYVNYFLKIKTECKGYPPNVKTECEKRKYIQKVFERENITLDPQKIIANPGLY